MLRIYMKLEYAKYLIEKTEEDYDAIAESFSESRKELWPELFELKKHIKDGERILDSGCGNGRLYELFRDKDVEYIGVDNSEKLIEKAREKYGDYFKVANLFELPFSDKYFDSIWSVAVFHHIPSKQLRLKALKEMGRVLKKNGKIIMTCWNLWQPNYLKLLLKFTLIKLFKGSKLDFKDIFVPKGVLIPGRRGKVRIYYHAFTKKELKKLFQKAGFKVGELRYLKRNKKKTNILVVAKK